MTYGGKDCVCVPACAQGYMRIDWCKYKTNLEETSIKLLTYKAPPSTAPTTRFQEA